MAQIVLVAAAWHGGWAVTPIARELRARGHEVFTPTLTGLGERSHLAHVAINLETHIEDVANVMRFERLTDVILCGHSYAGMVITGVADRLPESIATLVYCDAFVPQDGDSWWDLAGDRYCQLAIDRSKADGLGVVPPEHLDRRCTAHPIASFKQAIRLSGRWQEVREKVFIYAAAWPETPFRSTYETLQKDPAWTVTSLPTRHDIVRDAPQDLTAILLGLRAAARA
ncbi:MAG TPA: alpha/beta hydrolase [Steroidobacteraceae bacterium]|jgi:pimeloyl-ACP methyl ester carboxylesterase